MEAAIDQTLTGRPQQDRHSAESTSGRRTIFKRRHLLAKTICWSKARERTAYFASSTLDWYPERELDFGPAQKNAARASDPLRERRLQRDFHEGRGAGRTQACTPVRIDLERPLNRVEPQGGGAVASGGTVTGRLATTTVK